MASTNVTDLAYVKETVAGTTPDNPTFQRLPVKGVDLTDNIATATSEVLRKDRQIDDLVVVDLDVNGPVPYELTYAAFKPMMTALLQGGAAVADVSIAAATDIAAVSTSSQFTSTTTDFVSEGIVVGCYIRVAGFATAANNGVFKVTTVAANAITVDGTLTDEAATPAITIDAECYRNGSEVPDSFTFRKSFDAPGGVESIFYYRGCQISAMTMDFASGSILSGEMTVTGMTSEATDTPLTGESINDVAAYTLMNGVSSVTKVDLPGLPATAFFSTLSLTVDNNVNAKKGIGQLGARGLANFTVNVTASIEMYFEDLALYNKYKNSTPFSVAFILEDGDGNIMVISMPKCKFEELTEPVSGKDQFLMENGSLRALRDAGVTNCTIQFDFFPAV
ncbi:MAG: phage tail tube protein [Synergistaceae bacterium]